MLDDGDVQSGYGEPCFDLLVGHVGLGSHFNHGDTVSGGCDRKRFLTQRYHRTMELKRYKDAAPFEFGDFTVRELSPDVFSIGSVAEILVPMGAERDSRVSEKTHRMYVVVTGDLEFRVAGQTFRAGPGDTVHISAGEEYGFHNGGYEDGRLLLIRVPGPTRPERY